MTAAPPMTAAAPAISPRRAWWLAIRPQTLPAAVAPVLVGLGAAVGIGTPFRLDTAAGALAVALLLQVVANLANDLSDFRKGADTPDRQGPLRVAAAGLITPRQLEIAIAIVIGLAGLVGLYLVWVGGVVLLLLGGAAILAALLYTGGPMPYGYKGMGEVFVFLFFGLVAVTGTAYLQSLTVEPIYLAASVPVGALVTAILVVNNLRDVPTDRVAGKRTLAVIFGERFAKNEYLVLLGVAAVVPVLLVWAGSLFSVLLPLAVFARTKPLTDAVLAVSNTSDRRQLNLVLKGTARLSLGYAVLFAIGLAIGA
ncbi:MAG: 1,4-dihydroxy-2-naphthoate polyprenyltransferase [Chloroflexota bacterium]